VFGILAQVGIPLTMAQLEAISLKGAISALVAAHQHLLAARACRQLGLDVSQARPLPLRGQQLPASGPVAASGVTPVTVRLLDGVAMRKAGLLKPLKTLCTPAASAAAATCTYNNIK
jgi:hypothetical protein